MQAFLALAGLLAIIVPGGHATTEYWVSPGGSDGAAGSEGAPFATIGAALDAAAADWRVVHLEADAVFNGTGNVALTVPGGTFIDGNGATIECGGERALSVASGVVNVTALTLTGCAASDGGRGGGMAVAAGIGASAAVFAEDVTFSDSDAPMGGGLSVSGLGASFRCSGCSFDGNSASKGGGIYVIEGEVRLEGSTLTANTALLGGAFCADSATIVLSDVDVTGNDAYSAGAGYTFLSELEFVGGDVSNNEGTDDDVGGLFLTKTSFLLQDLTFDANECGDDAGAVKVHMETDARQEITRCSFTDNIADDKGGAVYISDGGVDVSDCDFSGNVGGIGGALIMSGGSNTLHDASFADNEASEGGSALYLRKLKAAGNTHVSNVTISGGTAPQGGGIFAARSVATLEHVWIEDTEAEIDGGGFGTDDECDLTISHLDVRDCTAPNGGGMAVFSPLTCDDCTLVGNTADGGSGGGLFVGEAGTVSAARLHASGNAAADGLGGGVYAGDGGELTLSGAGVLEGNEGTRGGGAAVGADSTLAIADATAIQDNEAAQAGGGVFRATGATYSGSPALSGNTAGSYGDGAATAPTTLTVTGADEALSGTALSLDFLAADADGHATSGLTSSSLSVATADDGVEMTLAVDGDHVAAGQGSLSLVVVANPGSGAVTITFTLLSAEAELSVDLTLDMLDCPAATHKAALYDADDHPGLYVCEELPALEYLAVDGGTLTTVLPLVGVVALVLLWLCKTMWQNRKISVYRGASPRFSLMAFAGSALALVGCVLFALDPHTDGGDSLCAARLWVFSTGAVTLLATLSAKTYRVWKVFGNKKLKAVKLPDGQLFRLTMRVVAVQWVINVLWMAVDAPVVELHEDYDSLTAWHGCSANASMLGLSVAVFYLMSAATVALAWHVRDCPSYFNESKWLALGQYTILLCSALYLAIMFALDPEPAADAVFRAGITCLCVLVTMALIFGSKAYIFLSGHGNKDLMVSNATMRTSGPGGSGSGSTHSTHVTHMSARGPGSARVAVAAADDPAIAEGKASSADECSDAVKSPGAAYRVPDLESPTPTPAAALSPKGGLLPPIGGGKQSPVPPLRQLPGEGEGV